MKCLRYGLASMMLLITIGSVNASVPLGGNRKGVGGSYDMYGCMQSNDYYVVNFAAYQTAASADSKSLPVAECIDLPAAGKTQLAIDLLDMDVRKKPVALKILREDGQVMADIPMAIAKNGVISTTVDFKTAGKYQAILLVDDKDLHTPLDISALHIPLTVALVTEQSAGGNSLWVLTIALGVLVAGAAYFVPRWLKPKSAELIN